MTISTAPPIWAKEQGKDILFISYRYLSPNQIVEQFKLAVKMGKEKGGDLLVLSDFKNVPVTKAVVDELKIIAREAVKEQKVKSAILGITGIKRFLITIYSQFSNDRPVPFDSYEEAVDYLIQTKETKSDKHHHTKPKSLF